MKRSVASLSLMVKFLRQLLCPLILRPPRRLKRSDRLLKTKASPKLVPMNLKLPAVSRHRPGRPRRHRALLRGGESRPAFAPDRGDETGDRRLEQPRPVQRDLRRQWAVRQRQLRVRARHQLRLHAGRPAIDPARPAARPVAAIRGLQRASPHPGRPPVRAGWSKRARAR